MLTKKGSWQAGLARAARAKGDQGKWSGECAARVQSLELLRGHGWGHGSQYVILWSFLQHSFLQRANGRWPPSDCRLRYVNSGRAG